MNGKEEFNIRLKEMNEALDTLKNDFLEVSKEVEDEISKLENKLKYLKRFSEILSSFSSEIVTVDTGNLIVEKSFKFDVKDFIKNIGERHVFLRDELSKKSNDDERKMLLKELDVKDESEILNNINNVIKEINSHLSVELFIIDCKIHPTSFYYEENDEVYLIRNDASVEVTFGIK